MPVCGDLSTMSLVELLRWASQGQRTGVLEVEQNKICRRIEFRKGWIGACSTDDPPAQLGQILLSPHWGTAMGYGAERTRRSFAPANKQTARPPARSFRRPLRRPPQKPQPATSFPSPLSVREGLGAPPAAVHRIRHQATPYLSPSRDGHTDSRRRAPCPRATGSAQAEGHPRG